MRLQLRPISLRIANDYIERHHAQLGRVQDCEFCIGCYAGDSIVGVVVVERPRERYLDDGWTFELTRVCTDRRPPVASILIAAATRAAFAMGARYVLSHVPATDGAAAFRAAGWRRMEMDGVPIEFRNGAIPTHRWERYNAAGVEYRMREAA